MAPFYLQVTFHPMGDISCLLASSPSGLWVTRLIAGETSYDPLHGPMA